MHRARYKRLCIISLCVAAFCFIAPQAFRMLALHPHPLIIDITAGCSSAVDNFYWKINQVFAVPADAQHPLNVQLSHSVPNFECYLVRMDGNSDWRRLAGDILPVPKSQETHVVAVKARNTLGGETAPFFYRIEIKNNGVQIAPAFKPRTLQHIPFRFENSNAPGMKKLQELTTLQVKDIPDEWNRFLSLRRWVRSSIPFGFPKEDSSWNAVEILHTVQTAPQAAFLCDEYAAVFVSACVSAGLNARMVHLESSAGDGHYAAEVWSNAYQKWVFMDPLYDFSVCDSSTCYSALEIRSSLIGKSISPSPKTEFPTHEYPALFYGLQFFMANDFLSNPYDGLWDIVSGNVKTLRWTDVYAPAPDKLSLAGRLLLYYYVPRIGGMILNPYTGTVFLLIAGALWFFMKPAHRPAEKPRVLMIVSFFFPYLGGAEQQSLRLAEQLIKRGIAVSVLTRKLPGLRSFELIQGVPVHRCIRTLPWGKWFAVTYMLSVLWFLLRRRHTYDVIHCHLLQGFHSIVAIMVKALLRKNVIIKVGATGPLSDFVMIRKVVLGDFLLEKITRVDKLITVCSQSTAEALQEGFTFNQIAQIPNGVDTDQFKPFSSSNNQTNITFIGRLDMMKGVQFLLEAFKTVKEDGVIAHLTIIGDGPDREMLMNCARQAGIADSVSFWGEMVDIRPFLEKTAVFVLPSLSEGLSNVLLEAMACGLPVIATRVGGTTDMIADGKNGLLVEAGNTEQLTAAMRKALTDHDLGELLGREARRTIEQSFAMYHVVDQYLKLYTDILSSRTAAP